MDAECLIAFTSLNQVALLKRALQRVDICVPMQRSPRALAEKGCGFAICCRLADLGAVLDVCRERNIEPGGILEVPNSLAVGTPRALTEEELEG